MKSLMILAVAGLVSTVAYATPKDTTSVSAVYTNNKAMNAEGINLAVTTYAHRNLTLEGNVLVNSDKMYSLGANVGLPLRVQNTMLIVTPQLGIDYYRDAKEVVGTAGVKADYEFYKGISLTTSAKYAKAFENNANIEGGVYSVGLTKRF